MLKGYVDLLAFKVLLEWKDLLAQLAYKARDRDRDRAVRVEQG